MDGLLDTSALLQYAQARGLLGDNPIAPSPNVGDVLPDVNVGKGDRTDGFASRFDAAPQMTDVPLPRSRPQTGETFANRWPNIGEEMVGKPFGLGSAAVPGGAQAPMSFAPLSSPSEQPAVPQTSLLGRIGNFLGANSNTLLAMGAGMAGAPSIGTGLGRGFAAALPARQADIRQQYQNATVAALMQRGLPQADALAIASNPVLMQQIAGQLFGPKQLQFVPAIAHDIYNNPIPGFVDPIGAKTYDLTGKLITSPAAAGGQSTGLGAVDQNKPMFDQLPKPQQGIVDSMLAGRMPMPSGMALKTPYWNTMLAAADERAKAQGQDGFDATTWGQRNATNKDFGSQGKAGQTINALETVAGHITKLSDAAEKLDNSGWTAWNQIRNGIARNTPLDPNRTKALQEVEDARKAVVDEMGKAYKGGQLSDAEVRDWSALINSADSKTKMRQALSDFGHLLESKRQALLRQYHGIMGKEFSTEGTVFPSVLKAVEDRNAGMASAPAPAAAAGSDPLAEARAAIAAGAPRDAVIQRLQQHGVNPAGL